MKPKAKKSNASTSTVNRVLANSEYPETLEYSDNDDNKNFQSQSEYTLVLVYLVIQQQAIRKKIVNDLKNVSNAAQVQKKWNPSSKRIVQTLLNDHACKIKSLLARNLARWTSKGTQLYDAPITVYKDLPYQSLPCARGELFSISEKILIQQEIPKTDIGDKLLEIQVILKDNITDNPLALWKKEHPRCSITLKSPAELGKLKIKLPIRLPPMKATPEDREDFKDHIGELNSSSLGYPNLDTLSLPLW
ncbi:hypothetical protein LWI28_026218 [Acer negundo]|uniref:Uncharacterized protein n=1 Tax=Acer negundo TaxID=4023 RepID=A0AAD5J836_ACENE|nr:hypothetical protein LWI28_026218 [Acer negundo]